MIFREDCSPRLGDFGRDGLFTDEAALALIEATASRHADSVNDDLIDGSRAGLAWIVMEWRVEIARRPRSGEELTSETWIVCKAPTAMLRRQFRVSARTGETLIRAEAVMVLLDTGKGRLARITEEAVAPYGPEEETAFEDAAPRLAPPREYASVRPVSLRRGDIDYNGHVHNTKYIDIAREALPEDAPPARSFRVKYIRPVREGDEVSLGYAEEDGVRTVAVLTGGTAAAVVRWEYR